MTAYLLDEIFSVPELRQTAEELAELARRRSPRRADELLVRVEGEHRGRPLGATEREPPVAAADLEDAQAVQVDELADRRELDAVGVDDHHGATLHDRLVIENRPRRAISALTL